jgi:hypothetical protein
MRLIAPCFPIILLGAASLPAQVCSDSTTVLHTSENVVRSASNQVWSFAQSWVTGDYATTWTASVSATTTFNGSQTHSGGASQSGGNIATVQWYDAPSTYGSGTYAEADTHTFSNTCGGSGGPYNYSPSLSVAQPSITGVSGVWYLGGGSDSTNGYYNQAALTGNPNCNSGDTCSNTPAWSVTANASKVTLTCSVCTNQTVTGSVPSDAVGDIQISMNIGGFAAPAFSFTVDTPASLDSAMAPYDTDYYDGFYSAIYYNTLDEFGNLMSSISLNEQFSSPGCSSPVSNFCPDQTNNWNKPTAYGLSGYAGSYRFDQIYLYSCSSGTGTTPPCTGPQSPSLSTSTVDHSTQTWSVGSSSVGSGVQVQYDTFQRYVDHGRHNSVVSPVH